VFVLKKIEIMKTILFSVLFLLMGSLAIAQSEESYTAHNEGWLVDLDEAYAQSIAEDKPIMANFTGSDWCGWCKKLTRAVFDKPEFKEWANENVVLLELDYPRRFKLPEKYQKQNASLQQAFKITGFPTVWVFNMEKDPETGKYNIAALGKTGYAPSVDQFTTEVDKMLDRAANP
jgi:protein disulfide-isomerase